MRSVTLHARVWIEIAQNKGDITPDFVTLHARVWIEISSTISIALKSSVTLRVRRRIENLILHFWIKLW